MDVRSGVIVEGPAEALEEVDQDLQKARGAGESQLVPVKPQELEKVRAMPWLERKLWAKKKYERRQKRKAQRVARKRQR